VILFLDFFLKIPKRMMTVFFKKKISKQIMTVYVTVYGKYLNGHFFPFSGCFCYKNFFNIGQIFE
jgi:hypothetical protein